MIVIFFLKLNNLLSTLFSDWIEEYIKSCETFICNSIFFVLFNPLLLILIYFSIKICHLLHHLYFTWIFMKKIYRSYTHCAWIPITVRLVIFFYLVSQLHMLNMTFALGSLLVLSFCQEWNFWSFHHVEIIIMSRNFVKTLRVNIYWCYWDL